MASIHPPTPTTHGNPSQDKAQSTLDSARTLTRERTRNWEKFLPRPDIPNCIALSKLRCIITLVSFVLLMTDIPRTGLGVRNLQEYYPVPLMPSTAVRFGPFNYPVLHLWRLDNGTSIGNSDNGSNNISAVIAGLKGTQPISTARVWSYQYDTTSVGLRGAVELLNVNEFPSYLLYKPEQGQPSMNANSLMDLNTVFTMLDAFITASRIHMRPTKNKPTMLRYATKHNWVDRLHHYVVHFFSKNPAWRLHSLHVPLISHDTLSLAICSNNALSKRSTPRPRFCNHPGIWKCKNPLDASLHDIRLWDHMDLRLQSLQQRYPELQLDVVLISTQRLSSTLGAMQTTFYNYEALEMVVLTRGRRCVDIKGSTNSSAKLNSTVCTTVFVDDYRYERDIVQTNLVDWYGIISMLRGGAQAYGWIRVLLLGYGSYVVAGQSVDEKSKSISRLAPAISIVFKIPFQVIVYSSLLPVSAYVGALLLDSSFTDIFLDSYWASVGGAVNFKWVPFIQTTSVQMRGVWFLALFASALLFVMRRSRYLDDGIFGIRGLLISFTSSLTVFGPYKSVFYRDMDITDIFRIPDEGPTMDIVQSAYSGDCFNSSAYIFGSSAKTVRLCIVAVGAFAMVFKLIGNLTLRSSWTYRATRGMIFRLSQVAPCGIEMLWKTTSPIIHFWAPIRHHQTPNTAESMAAPPTPSQCHSSTSRVFPSPPPNVRGISEASLMLDSSHHQRKWNLWHFRTKKIVSATTTRIQPPSGGLTKRTVESHSILQLMNIAMMTDPWNFFWLRVVGIQLYLYKIRPAQPTSWDLDDDNNLLSYAVVLPYAEDEMEERTGLNSNDYQLLDSASSRDVPTSVLLQCG